MGSHTAYAILDEYDFLETGTIEIQHSVHYTDIDAPYSKGTIGSTGWLAGTTDTYQRSDFYSYSTYPSVYFLDRFSMRNTTEEMFQTGWNYTLTFSGLTNYSTWATRSSGNLYYCGNFDLSRVYVYDSNGQWVEITDQATVSVGADDSTGVYYINVQTGSVPFEVWQIDVDLIWRYGNGYWEDVDSSYSSGNWSYERHYGFNKFNCSWTGFATNPSTSESLEVSKGILETVKGIFSTLTELPGNIWSTFESGLTNLFVPDDQAISDMQEDWNNLLADRFGALYQVGDLVTDFADAFKESEQKTVTLPEITIPVGADGWTFGGWEVQVVPDGMGVLFTTLKTLVSIVATFLFVNGLKRRFEGLIGGAPTA